MGDRVISYGLISRRVGGQADDRDTYLSFAPRGVNSYHFMTGREDAFRVGDVDYGLLPQEVTRLQGIGYVIRPTLPRQLWEKLKAKVRPLKATASLS